MGASGAYQRGTVVLDQRRARSLVRAEHRRIDAHARRPADAVLAMGGVPLTRTDETQHFKFVGITGAGKTTAIAEMIAKALARGDRAIIADPDGVYSKRFYDAARGDVIFNPFDERSRKWDIFSEINDDYDIEDLARSLIPDSPNSHDGEWREYARTFFTDVTQGLWEASKRRPEYGTTGELHRLLTQAPVDELRSLLRNTASQSFLDENAAKMFGSIRAITSSAVRAFKYVARQKGEPLSVREWVKEGEPGKGGVLFLPYHAGEIEALRSTISAWMRLGIFEAMNREEGDQRLWFVVDELGALGKIGGLTDGLTRLRKFGGRLVLGFQSIDQVQALYGKNDANAIVENCGNTLLLRCGTANEGGTSKFASELIGQREMMRTATSRSYRGWTDVFGSKTESQQYYTEHAVMPAEIEQLANHSGYARVSSRPEWLQVTLPKPENDTRRTGNDRRRAPAMQRQSSAGERKPSLFANVFSYLRRLISPFLGRAPPQAHLTDLSSSTRPSGFSPLSTASTPMQVSMIETAPNSVAATAPTDTQLRAASSASANTSPAPGTRIEDRGPISRVVQEKKDVRIHQFADGSTAFVQRGRTLHTEHEEVEVARAMLKEMKDQNWKHVKVDSSSPAFSSTFWELASQDGMKVHGYTPTRAQREALAEREAKNAAAIKAAESRSGTSVSHMNAFERLQAFAGNVLERGRQFVNTQRAAVSAAVQTYKAVAHQYSDTDTRYRVPAADASGKQDRSKSRDHINAVQSGALGEAVHADAAQRHGDIRQRPAVELNSIQYVSPDLRQDVRQDARQASSQQRQQPAASSVDTTTIPEHVVQNLFTRQGNSGVYTYSRTGAEAFRDQGTELNTRSDDARVIDTFVQIAKSRSWKTINVAGTEEFRREAWMRAVNKGLEVTGFEPTADDRATLAARQEKARAQARNAISPNESAAPTKSASAATPAPSQPSPKTSQSRAPASTSTNDTRSSASASTGANTNTKTNPNSNSRPNSKAAPTSTVPTAANAAPTQAPVGATSAARSTTATPAQASPPSAKSSMPAQNAATTSTPRQRPDESHAKESGQGRRHRSEEERTSILREATALKEKGESLTALLNRENISYAHLKIWRDRAKQNQEAGASSSAVAGSGTSTTPAPAGGQRPTAPQGQREAVAAAAQLAAQDYYAQNHASLPVDAGRTASTTDRAATQSSASKGNGQDIAA